MVELCFSLRSEVVDRGGVPVCCGIVGEFVEVGGFCCLLGLACCAGFGQFGHWCAGEGLVCFV